MNDDFQTFDEYSKMKEFDRRLLEHESRKEAMNNHPAGKTTPPKLSDEASTHLGLAIFKFLFVTIPLALLLAGLAVQPLFEAAWGADLGFWTAFFLLMTLRWLIPRQSKQVPLKEFYAKRSR